MEYTTGLGPVTERFESSSLSIPTKLEDYELAAKNDVTGDSIQSKTNSKQYADNWDRIFGKKKVEESKNDEAKTENRK